MTKLKGLLLTEGMHGMISQVEGLAKALNLDFIHEKIELNNFWKLIPPKLTPIQSFVFKNKIDKKKFSIVISCGRKSVIPSIYLKKKLKNKIMTIHIQDPKVSTNNFDYVIVPEHDGISGSNIVTSKGAIHYLRNDELDQNMNYLKSRLNKDKIVSLIMGGPNKYYNYDKKIIEKIFLKIQNNFIKNDYQLIFIPSMRTPKNIIELAKNYFDNDQIIITDIDKNAYLSSLRLADHIVVTCDSTSMISEAAITGKPVYVARMSNKLSIHRFEKFYKLFQDLGIIRYLDDKIEYWSYKGLDEVNRAAYLVKEKMKQNGII